MQIKLTVTPAGAELIVRALRAATPLPHAEIDGFVAELWTQYQAQAREQSPAPAPAEAATAVGAE